MKVIDCVDMIDSGRIHRCNLEDISPLRTDPTPVHFRDDPQLLTDDLEGVFEVDVFAHPFL